MNRNEQCQTCDGWFSYSTRAWSDPPAECGTCMQPFGGIGQ